MSKNTTYRCKKYYDRSKQSAIEHLGSKCVNCGITDPRVLQIDHVSGHLTGFGKGNNWMARHKKIISTIPGVEYQLLCANCNWIKRYENDEEREH